MEVLGLLFLVLFVLVALKIFSFFLNVTIFAIALPLKILAIVFGGLIFGLVCIPLGLFAGLASLVLAPFLILLPLAPFLLIIFGVYLIAKNA